MLQNIINTNILLQPDIESQKELVKLFTDLVKIAGPSKEEKAVADFIIHFLEDLGLSPTRDTAGMDSGGNTGNVICPIGHGGNMLLMSHMDTAESTAGINVLVEDDRIRSDGRSILGADNRAGIAILLHTVREYIRQGIPMRDLTLAFTVREELDMTGSMMIDPDPKINMGFIFDSSLRPGKFINRTYGSQGFEIEIKGRAAHSGIHPEQGISAITAAADAISSLSWGRLDVGSTANIGLIKGGSATNVIPEDLFLAGEVRATEKAGVEEQIQNISRAFQEAAADRGATVTFHSHWDFLPYHIQEDSKVYRMITDAIQVAGLQADPVFSPGGSDANSLNAKGIETVNIGIGAQNPHAKTEFILLQDLFAAQRICTALVQAEHFTEGE